MKATFLILAVAAASIASAATISSGTNASGGLLAAGAFDPFFTVTGPAGVTNQAFVVPNLFSCQYYNTGACSTLGTSSAQWITNSMGMSSPAGVYTFTEAFIVGTTSLSGIWATDNCGQLTVAGGTVTGGTIGGNTVATCNGSQSANFSVPTPFTISGLTVGQTYNLVFTVVNTEGPSALFVDAGPVGNAPEPSSIFSMLTGLGVVGFAIRRRQAAK